MCSSQYGRVKNCCIKSIFQRLSSGYSRRSHAVEWTLEVERLGAGEICVNSIDADDMKQAYELSITGKIAQVVKVPVSASSGAGTPQHLSDVLTLTNAKAALIASMLHYGTYTCLQIKEEIHPAGVPLRMDR